MLYVGMGDGGSGGDPQNRAQDPQSLLGKLLRLDVDRRAALRDPAGQSIRRPSRWPAVPRSGRWACATRGAAPSIRRAASCSSPTSARASGRRSTSNPPARAGVNYGWNILEGREPFRPAGRPMATLARPLVVYPHPDGCSITGGVVYRGQAVPVAGRALRVLRLLRRTGCAASASIDGKRRRPDRVERRLTRIDHLVRRRRRRRAPPGHQRGPPLPHRRRRRTHGDNTLKG